MTDMDDLRKVIKDIEATIALQVVALTPDVTMPAPAQAAAGAAAPAAASGQRRLLEREPTLHRRRHRRRLPLRRQLVQ